MWNTRSRAFPWSSAPRQVPAPTTLHCLPADYAVVPNGEGVAVWGALCGSRRPRPPSAHFVVPRKHMICVLGVCSMRL